MAENKNISAMSNELGINDKPYASTVAAVGSSMPEHKRTAPKSRGENVFNEVTYGGVGWLANAVVSTAVAYGLTESEIGKPHYERESKKLNKAFGRGINELERTKGFVRTFALMVGGTALIMPIKWLEDGKTKIVDKFNDWFGSDLTPEKEKISVKEMQEEPKQTWWTELGSRLVAVVVILTAVNFLKEKPFSIGKIFGSERFNNISIKSMIEDSASKMTNLFKKDSITIGKLQKIDAANKLLTEDVIVGAGYAGVMYGATRVLGKVFGDKEHQGDNPDNHVSNAEIKPHDLAENNRVSI